MSGREPVAIVVGVGLLTVVLLLAGAGTLGGMLALLQVGLLVGGPLALRLGDALRSRAATVVVSIALSLAITAVAVQSLVWFRFATAEAIVALATAYGVVLSVLLPPAPGRTPVPARSGKGDLWS